MNYTFDAFGRFAGVSDVETPRSTTISPSVLTPDYNWNGLSWVFAPDIPTVPVAMVVAPDPRLMMVVSPWQIRKALNAAGLRDDVEAAVAAADQETQDAWQYATEFRRLDPLVINLGFGLGKSEDDMDGLFVLAATL